jgi:hypothetical protein
MVRPVVLVSVALLMGGATALGAAPKPRNLGELPGPVRSDGGRLVAWSDGSYVRVKDTRDGMSFLAPVPPSCDFEAIGGGELLYACERDSGEMMCPEEAVPLLYSIATRAFHWPAGIDRVTERQGTSHASCTRITFAGVGRHGIFYVITYADGPRGELLDWRRGEARGVPQDARTIVDLDVPGLRRTLCDPLRRAPNRDYDPLEPVFGPPYNRQHLVEPFSIREGDGGAISLQRCGSRKRRPLARRFYTVGLTRRVAYWTDGYELGLVVLRSGRGLIYRFDGSPVRAVATNQRVYATVPDDPGPKTYVIKLPLR